MELLTYEKVYKDLVTYIFTKLQEKRSRWLSDTAKKFGLGKKVLEGFIEEKSGVVPNTKWKKKFIGQNWYLGETLHSGIGQGYFQSTPIQLCLMTAQIANGGFEIKPRII